MQKDFLAFVCSSENLSALYGHEFIHKLFVSLPLQLSTNCWKHVYSDLLVLQVYFGFKQLACKNITHKSMRNQAFSVFHIQDGGYSEQLS